MTFRDFEGEVRAAVSTTMAGLSYPSHPIELSSPPDPSLGDLSSSIPLKIAKSMNKNPKEIAEKLADHLNKLKHELISRCEPHPSGYLNFLLDVPNFTFRTLLACSRADYGKVDLGKGARAIVEHTSVNPAHHLHVGHLRNLAVGDFVARVLRFTGWKVVVLNYVDDLGLQVADLIIGLRQIGAKDEDSYKKYDQFCGRIYAQINELFEKNPELLTMRGGILNELEDFQSKTSSFARSVTRRVVLGQLQTCWRMGGRYDCLNFESHILSAGLWDELFKVMKEKGIVRYVEFGKLAGCWIVRIEGEEEGEEKVLVRSDGTSTYVAKDIPFAAWKLGLIVDPFRYEVFTPQPDGGILWSTTISDGRKMELSGADKVINVIDERQARLQRIVLDVLSQLQGKSMAHRYIHLSYGLVALSKQTAQKVGAGETSRGFAHMSGRRGIYVGADYLLDSLRARALEETAKRDPDGAMDWMEEVAEGIAVGAIRFALLKQDLGKQIVFDMEDALRLVGETGPYLQYTYARAFRILEKSGERAPLTKVLASTLSKKEEINLLKLISKLDIIVEEAANSLTPSVIARHAYHLCVSLNSFYESLPVLNEKDDDKRRVRLLLIEGFLKSLKTLLDLLGMKALARI